MDLYVFLCLVYLPAAAWCRPQSAVRIVGGTDTDISLYRHQLSLRASGSHSCGASLISSTRAVTTAHCLGLAISSYSVLAGSTSRLDTGCATCVVRSLTNYVRYPTYVDDGLQGYPNDIAVIMFSAIGSSSAIGYVALASSADGNFAGATCSVTGWGLTTSGGTQAVILQEASMTVMDNADCDAAWPTTSINTGQICMTSPTVSTCAGDNGGPMICGTKLAGATSWQASNCNPAFPSVFTRISEYKSWIDGQ